MFELGAYLEERRKRIDAALDSVLPSLDVRPGRLHEAMRYSVFSGGKRLRPVLTTAACESVGGSVGTALPAAVSIELIHTYTLIHDDLPCMDDDDLRRGKPTSHVAYGEANAILAADALQALAFEVAASAPVPARYPASQIVLELAGAAGSRGVVGGQVEDLAACRGTSDADMIEYIHRHKTADLFRAATRIGAIAGNAEPAQLQALGKYGAMIGMAFQIADDILDAGPADVPTDGQEDSRKTLTCLSVYGEEGARRRAASLIAQASAEVENIGKDAVKPLLAIARFAVERTH